MSCSTQSDVTIERTLITSEPYVDWNAQWSSRGAWPVQWICHPGVHADDVVVMAFRSSITCETQQKVRLHITADERYELFIDGERVARGSEAGSPEQWFYETYDITFSKGTHALSALVWHLGTQGPSPCTQMSIRPGFFCAAEGDAHAHLSTGVALWESHIITGYSFSWPYPTELPFTGARIQIDGSKVPWDALIGRGSGWIKSQSIGHGAHASMVDEQSTATWLLAPATLPAMALNPVENMLCRHVERINTLSTEKIPVSEKSGESLEVTAWNALLTTSTSLQVPAHSMRRCIIDLNNYHCGYTNFRVSHGKGSYIRVGWAEGLYDEVLANAGGYTVPSKGNRSAIENKYFKGFADTFLPDGTASRMYRPLWWSAGRYLEIVIQTQDEPLTIENFSIEETHFPFTWKGSFESSDPRMAELFPLYKRTLEMCSHEIYMDCPHYEQLMYVADTRLEVLQTYVMTDTIELPKKAIKLFDASRRPNGLTQSRFPTRVTQVIPPFSLWWVGMVHDLMLYRSEKQFISERMTTVRSVLDAFRFHCTDENVIAAPVGWNFIDWVKAWNRGVPPDGERGLSSPISLQAALIYNLGAQLEDYMGEPALAKRNRDTAQRITDGVKKLFWNEGRGMFADDLEHQSFSEHAQCLALLNNGVDGQERKQVIDGLLTATDLHRATIYFSHYLFETYRHIGRVDLLCERMNLWYGLKALGLFTTLETPEPSRSDCHGWGAHPMFHYFGTILGIRPVTPGFTKARITPQLGTLSYAHGKMVHPSGLITAHIVKEGDTYTGSVELPRGVFGVLVCNGEEKEFTDKVNF